MPWLARFMLLGALAPGRPATAPMSLVVATARGEARIPVRTDGTTGPMVAAPALLAALGGKAEVVDAWADVEIARQNFRLVLGAPYYSVGAGLKPLVGSAVVKRDTLFLPLQFVTNVIPAELKDRYRYIASAGRLEDLAAPPTGTTAAAGAPRNPKRLPNGLNKGYVVAVDPGHGGVDPGNPGIYFPRGLTESDVTLQVGLLVREELLNRGVGVVMTRTTDTLIDIRQRASYCSDRCNLFVSIHVNSLPRRPGFNKVRGFETYFLADAKTEDAARVAKMENEAVRFDQSPGAEPGGGLDFILKDLQLNEYLRESGRLAELIQSHLGEVHSGPDKGVKQAGLWVLTTARRPAVLVEMGFSTNPEDAKVMSDARSQRNLAGSIADAVVSYLLEYQRRVSPDAETRTVGGRE